MADRTSSGRPASSYAGGKIPEGRPAYQPSADRVADSQGGLGIGSGVQRFIGEAARGNVTRDSSGRVSFGIGSDDPNAFNPSGPAAVPGVTMSFPMQFGGTYGSQRMGSSPDRFEAFPYGRVTITQDEAELMYDALSPYYQDWLDALAKTPGIGAPASTGRAFWGRLVERSVGLQEDGIFMSPQQMASQIAMQRGIGIDLGDPASYSGYSGGGSGYYGGGGGFGGSSTQRTVDITTPAGARALLTRAMQGLLGRDPNEDEIATFTKSLNESQQANPQIVTASGDTVTRTGGFEADVFATEFVQNQDEFQEVQATQYYRGLISALTGGGI